MVDWAFSFPLEGENLEDSRILTEAIAVAGWELTSWSFKGLLEDCGDFKDAVPVIFLLTFLLDDGSGSGFGLLDRLGGSGSGLLRSTSFTESWSSRLGSTFLPFRAGSPLFRIWACLCCGLPRKSNYGIRFSASER